MAETSYIHVIHAASGAHDMIPERAAAVLAAAGDVEIVDPTPGRYRRFKPNVPLGTSVRPKRTEAATTVATESAPEGASTAEEATE